MSNPARPYHAIAFALLTALAITPAADGEGLGPGGVPDPSSFGPFDVGHTQVELVDPARGNRLVPSEVWYPADPGAAIGPSTFYPLLGPIGLTSEVAVDDIPPTREPSRPLVAFSHGSGGIAIQSIILCETLASHGFFVVSPSHTGNTQFDIINGTTDPFDVVVRNRPLDISFVIDEMLARSHDPDHPFFERISHVRIGVTGHSFGGYTTLAMASGHDDVPPDRRVRAILPVSGSANILTDAELESIRVPTLHLGGTNDTAVPIDPVTVRAFELIRTPGLKHYRVDIIGATHNHFANVCDIGQALIDLGLPPEVWDAIGAGGLIGPYNDACVPPAFPIEEAKRLQNLYTVAFFQYYLAHEPGYARFLAKTYAERFEPDVIVFRAQPNACGLGFELALLLPPLLWLRSRRRTR